MAGTEKMMQVTIIDQSSGQGQKVVIDGLLPSDRVEVLKHKIGETLRNWRRVDQVLMLEKGGESTRIEDGRTLAEEQVTPGCTIMLISSGTLQDAADHLRDESGKKEDGDEEEWGIYGTNPNAKIKVDVLQHSEGHQSATFTIKKEGNTLGNALRHFMIQNPTVLQCGYSIPHPLEDEMVMEVTAKAYPPDLMCAGLNVMAEFLDESADCFEAAMERFESGMDVE
ncbi:DNA-directed RNA polymerases I and III subunit RPAC2 [Diplonema papillatum]|nr:DNA-directed RNA polymerases I and III subunit RPAC2 [Diplonema papillatum]|eukprot:gene8188-12622_t